MKYKSLIKWDGSPNGCIIRTYEADTEYDHSALGDDLAEVALREKWIEVVGAEEPQAEAVEEAPVQVVEVTLEMVKDGMTVKQMQAALKDAGVYTRAKKEEPLAKLILKHKLFIGE